MSDAFFTVEYLTAGYGKATVLHNVSFPLSAGSVTLLTGRNGVGKSTLMKSLIGLVPTSKAMVRLENTTLITARKPGNPIEIARAGIGYVPEERRVFSDLSVAENLIAGEKQGPGPVWNQADIMELFPPLRPLLSRRAGQLSGGEQQMLAIARTLMGAPKLLLLDEPSEGLAPVIVNRLAGALRDLAARGLTILIAEQNWRFAISVASDVLVMDQGQIVHRDSMAGFAADTDAQSRLLGIGNS